MNKKLISIIVSCYNEEKSIELFYKEFKKMVEKMPDNSFELIFVNDGSRDKTLKNIKKLSAGDKTVKYISLSRNFGKEAAMLAGLDHVRGDYVALMDADLQDPPSLLPKMYDELIKGNFDQIATRRVSRKGEPPIRSFFARRFYKLINRISNVKIVDGARDYRLMTRQVVDAIVSMREYNRFSKGIFSFVGFKTKWLEYENIERRAGETKWSFWKLFKYAIEGIVAFSTAPLIIATILGAIISVAALVFIVFIIIRTAVFGDPVAGWPSMMSIILFLGGIQLIGIGILGQYLARTYLESKHRPIYIIKESSENKRN